MLRPSVYPNFLLIFKRIQRVTILQHGISPLQFILFAFYFNIEDFNCFFLQNNEGH